jgi:hypothetical protein
MTFGSWAKKMKEKMKEIGFFAFISQKQHEHITIQLGTIVKEQWDSVERQHSFLMMGEKISLAFLTKR